MLVTKRNNEKEPFDVEKVKQSIAFACEGVDVNPLELESRLDYFMKNGIKTSDIQLNIIEHAKQLATPQYPQWLMVAGHAGAFTEKQALWRIGRLRVLTLGPWTKGRGRRASKLTHCPAQ